MELRRAALALLGGVALIASSCSTAAPSVDSPTTQLPAAVNPVFARGGTVTVAVPYLPTNFNPSTPAGSNRVTQMVMEQVWPQAFVVDTAFQPGTTGFIDGAEVVGLNPMKVSYQIDPKATWSDGYPITAADFVYNWHEQLSFAPLLPFAGDLAGYRDISSISSSNGGKTVTVSFKTPYADWEDLFANLIPAHIAERTGWVGAFEGFHASEVISGGPFIISAVEPGKRLVLTRNSSYWGTPAHLHSIVFVVEPSARASLEGLQNGSVGVAEVEPGPSVETTIARSLLDSNALSVATTPSPELWQLVFNLNDPVVGNRLVRQALALATDRDQLVADSVSLDDPASLGAVSRVFATGQPGSFSEPAPTSGYNPFEAESVFKSLGYVPDVEGDLRAVGSRAPLTLTLSGPTGDPVLDSLELQLQAEWASCGVDLNIHNVPMDDLLANVLPRGEYQLALAPYLMPSFPSWNAIIYTNTVVPVPSSPAESLGTHEGPPSGSTAKDGGSGGSNGSSLWSVTTPSGTEPGAAAIAAVTRDVTGLGDPEVGNLFEQVLSELNANAQAQLLSKLDAQLSHDLPTIPLFQEPVSLVQQSDIVNVSESPTWAGPMWDAEDWAIQLSPPIS